jgi:hypothetical protein
MPHFGIMTIKARPYTLYSNILYKLRPNAVLRQCLNGPRVVRVLSKLHEGLVGEHYGIYNTMQKI